MLMINETDNDNYVFISLSLSPSLPLPKPLSSNHASSWDTGNSFQGGVSDYFSCFHTTPTSSKPIVGSLPTNVAPIKSVSPTLGSLPGGRVEVREREREGGRGGEGDVL